MTRQVIALLVHVELEDGQPISYGCRSATAGIKTEHSGSSYLRILDETRDAGDRQIGTIGCTSNITDPGCLILRMGDMQKAIPTMDLPAFAMKDEFTGKRYTDETP